MAIGASNVNTVILPERPTYACLMKNDTLLIVCCNSEELRIFSISEDPMTPVHLTNLFPPSISRCLLSLNTDELLCGQEEGFLSVVNVSS